MYGGGGANRCNCPGKHGPTNNGGYDRDVYGGVCAWWLGSAHFPGWTFDFIRTGTCPKGWGRSHLYHSGDDEYVNYGTGYVSKSIQEPVYGYVTRYRTQYRTAYYTYISARVAKA